MSLNQILDDSTDNFQVWKNAKMNIVNTNNLQIYNTSNEEKVFTNGASFSAPVSIKFIKIDKLVFCHIDKFSFVGGSNTLCSAVGAIPLEFRPSSDTVFITTIVDFDGSIINKNVKITALTGDISYACASGVSAGGFQNGVDFQYLI